MSFSKLFLLSFVLFCTIGISACDWQNEEPQNVIVPREVADSLYITTSSGLRYYDFEDGEGDVVAQDDDAATVNYVLWNYPQKLWIEGNPTQFRFVLGVQGPGGAIAGFDEAIHGMKKNTERQFIVPSNLAYGTGDLLFEVQVVAIDTTGR